MSQDTSVKGPTILLAWHHCGKVVAAMVSRPEWPDDTEHRENFVRNQAGRSITECSVRMTPPEDEWCRCFKSSTGGDSDE